MRRTIALSAVAAVLVFSAAACGVAEDVQQGVEDEVRQEAEEEVQRLRTQAEGEAEQLRTQAEERAEDRILDAMLPRRDATGGNAFGFGSANTTTVDIGAEPSSKESETRQKLRRQPSAWAMTCSATGNSGAHINEP